MERLWRFCLTKWNLPDASTPRFTESVSSALRHIANAASHESGQAFQRNPVDVQPVKLGASRRLMVLEMAQACVAGPRRHRRPAQLGHRSDDTIGEGATAPQLAAA